MRAPIRRTGRKGFRVGEIAPIRVEAMIGHLTIMAIAVLGAAACVCAFPDAKLRDYARKEKPSPAGSADEGQVFGGDDIRKRAAIARERIPAAVRFRRRNRT
jgi:hypothetical protein